MLLQLFDDSTETKSTPIKDKNDFISVSTRISVISQGVHKKAIAALELCFPECSELVEGRLGSFLFHIHKEVIFPTFIYPYGIGIKGVRHKIVFDKKIRREHLLHKGIAAALECLTLMYHVRLGRVELDTYIIEHDTGLGVISILRDQQLDGMGVKSNRLTLRSYLKLLSRSLSSDSFRILKPENHEEILQLLGNG